VFWLLALVALITAAAVIRSDVQAREIGDALDKDLGTKPCEDCNEL
jgi:hypothetical protein